MSLKQLAITGAKWTTLSAIVVAFLTIIQLIVLARILGPEAYGLMGMVLIVVGLAQAFTDFGISNAIIYRQDATKDQLSSLYWLNVMAGSLMFIIIVILSPLIALFFNEPQLYNLLLLISITFLIIPFGQQYQILLKKELIFDSLAIVEILNTICSVSVSIILAIYGFGVYSIVWGTILATVVRTFALFCIGFKNGWLPKFQFRKSALDGYINFGIYQMGERTVNYFNTNIDKIIIGGFIGAEALGFYSIAFNLIIYPISLINPIINKIAFPVFAKLQCDLKALRSGYFQVLKTLSLINFPIYFGFASTAFLIIPLFFGSQWTPSIIIAEILAGVGLIRSTGNPVGSLLLAKGYAKLGFTWNLLLMFTQIPGIIIGAYFGGIIGVAIAFLILQSFYFGLSYHLLIKKVIGSCLDGYLKSMSTAFWMSVIMAGGVVYAGLIIQNYSMIVRLICLVSLGVLVYLGLIIHFEKPFLSQMYLLLFHKEN